jgi:hypothetical protein
VETMQIFKVKNRRYIQGVLEETCPASGERFLFKLHRNNFKRPIFKVKICGGYGERIKKK